MERQIEKLKSLPEAFGMIFIVTGFISNQYWMLIMGFALIIINNIYLKRTLREAVFYINVDLFVGYSGAVIGAIVFGQQILDYLMLVHITVNLGWIMLCILLYCFLNDED